MSELPASMNWAKITKEPIPGDPDHLVIGIDGFVVYPLYLDELGAPQVDHYWLEVARRCFTEDLVAQVGAGLHLRIVNAGDFALAKHQEGKGEASGSMEFRRHYRKLVADRAKKK